jgi:hypothetical protein
MTMQRQDAIQISVIGLGPGTFFLEAHPNAAEVARLRVVGRYMREVDLLAAGVHDQEQMSLSAGAPCDRSHLRIYATNY